MAENPFDSKSFGLLAALGAEPRWGSLLDYVTSSTPLPLPPARSDSNLGGLSKLFGPSEAAPANALSAAVADPFSTSPRSTSFGSLAGLLASEPPLFASPSPRLSFGSLADLGPPPAPSSINALYDPPSSTFSSALEPPLFVPPSPSTRPFGSLADLVAPPARSSTNALYAPQSKPQPIAPQTKRKAFFSFHFDDIMRVNNVRNAWKITHPDSSLNRSFYDSSLWEARKLERAEGIKQLIRAGVLGTSAVCILAGSTTWDRRWVKYEIARAVIDSRGLLTVHINSINHHRTKDSHPLGPNPLAHMGVAKLQPDKRMAPQYHLFEMKWVLDGNGGVTEQWSPYRDYTQPVKKPGWLSDPDVGYVMPLSVDTAEYDYERDHGHRNIGSWIDQAAKQAGR
jgi:hypothetical protein